MQNAVLSMAIKFAECGYYVFPLMDTTYERLTDDGKKKPLIMPYNWTGSSQKHPPEQHIVNTDDKATIQKWPDEISRIYGQKMVLAGYGVVGRSCVVFDLDIKGGKNGLIEYNKLAELFKMPEPAMVVKTKSGGFHYYFGRPTGFELARIKNAASVVLDGKAYDGVDVRANKGYVVGPMTRVIDKTWVPGNYTLLQDHVVHSDELSKCDTHVMNLLGDQSVQYDVDALKSMIASNEFQSAEEMAKQLVIPPKVQAGERNNVFYAFVSAAVRKGIPENTLRGLLVQLVDVTEGKENISEFIDIEDLIKRSYDIDLANPYAIANDMVRRGMYRLSSHSLTNLTYFTMDETYLSMDRPLSESQLAEVTSRFDRAKVNKDGSISPRMDNVGKIIKALIPRENEISRFGYVPGSRHICDDESGKLRVLNLWKDPRDLIVEDKDFKIDVWTQFLWLVERLCGAGTFEQEYLLQFFRWLLMNPGSRPVTYPLLVTAARGTGKNLLTECFAHCLGYNKLGSSQTKILDKSALQNARFLNPTMYSLILFDEVEFAKAAGSYSAAVSFNQSIKTLTTCSHYPVEIKGGAAFDAPMYAGMIMTSNSVKGTVIDDDDRRTNLIYSDVAPLNEHGGQVDDLFKITKKLGPISERMKSVGTIIKGLCDMGETMKLDRQRARDSEIKREARKSTMPIPHRIIEELLESGQGWTPVVDKSIVKWIVSHSLELANSKFTDYIDDTVDDIFRSDVIHRINLPTSGTYRQFTNVPTVDLTGNVVSNPSKRPLFYIGYPKTAGMSDPSKYSKMSGRTIGDLYMTNIEKIQESNGVLN